MVQPGTVFACAKQNQVWRNCRCCSRLQFHSLSTAWRAVSPQLLLVLLLLLPTSALLLHSLLGLHVGAAAEAAGNEPQPRMAETLHQFRSHQVATGAAAREGVTKFVLQESGGVPPTGQESGSESSRSSSSWRTLSFKEVAGLWRSSPAFADMFAASIAAVPSEALFWESAPVTRSTMVSEERDDTTAVYRYSNP